MIKLKDILAEVDDGTEAITIEYRTNIQLGDIKEDIFTGACKYEDGVLTALDHDTYSLEDEFITYVWDSYNQLSVWYESEWTDV